MRRRAVLYGGMASLLPVHLAAVTQGIYITENGEVLGPFDEAALRDRIKSVADAKKLLVWHQGMPDWAPATHAPALAAFVATLPVETPVDFSAYVVGTWLSIDAIIKPEDKTFIGRHKLSLAPGGTYEGEVYAQYIKRYWQPGPKPGSMEFVDKSLYVHFAQNGKYKIEPADSFGRYSLEFEGKAISHLHDISSKSSSEKFRKLVTIVSSDHMTTSLGENYTRQVS